MTELLIETDYICMQAERAIKAGHKGKAGKLLSRAKVLKAEALKAAVLDDLSWGKVTVDTEPYQFKEGCVFVPKTAKPTIWQRLFNWKGD